MLRTITYTLGLRVKLNAMQSYMHSKTQKIIKVCTQLDAVARHIHSRPVMPDLYR